MLGNLGVTRACNQYTFRRLAGYGRTQSMNPILLFLLTAVGASLFYILMLFVLVGKKK